MQILDLADIFSIYPYFIVIIAMCPPVNLSYKVHQRQNMPKAQIYHSRAASAGSFLKSNFISLTPPEHTHTGAHMHTLYSFIPSSKAMETRIYNRIGILPKNLTW